MKGPFALDDSDVFYCRHVGTVTLFIMQTISDYMLTINKNHKKDGRQRRLHRLHVSRPPLTRPPLDSLLCCQVQTGPKFPATSLFTLGDDSNVKLHNNYISFCRHKLGAWLPMELFTLDDYKWVQHPFPMTSSRYHYLIITKFKKLSSSNDKEIYFVVKIQI